MAAVISQSAVPAHQLSKSAQTEAAGLSKVVANLHLSVPRGDVTATFNFYKAPEDGSTPFNYVGPAPEGQPQSNVGIEVVEVPVQDIRGHEDEFSLDNDAFQVIQNVPESAEKEFTSEESIKKNFYPEVEKLLLEQVPGAQRVVIFDHTIRRPNPEGPEGRGPVLRAHVDQTQQSAKQRVKLHTGEEAEELLKGRYRIINVWRSINGTVFDTPLGFASSASVDDHDIIPVEHRYPDRTGMTAAVRYNESQKWLYWSGMTNDERLLLECFDSEALKEGSSVKGGRVPHSAFVDPRTPAGAPGRESIEVRTLVFGA